MGNILKNITFAGLVLACTIAININSQAAIKDIPADTISQSVYMAKTSKSGVVVRDSASEGSSPLATLPEDSTYAVLGQEDNGWIKVSLGGNEGYIKVADGVYVYETLDSYVDEGAELRSKIVNYALSFLGGSYVYGGSDPNTGVDCSGFTSYVMRNVLGINLSHSSRAQSGEGKSVSSSELKPGDLVFYSTGGNIDHVAIYIGDGQIVHASSEKTGIKISTLDHRQPVKMVSVVG